MYHKKVTIIFNEQSVCHHLTITVTGRHSIPSILTIDDKVNLTHMTTSIHKKPLKTITCIQCILLLGKVPIDCLVLSKCM